MIHIRKILNFAIFWNFIIILDLPYNTVAMEKNGEPPTKIPRTTAPFKTVMIPPQVRKQQLQQAQHEPHGQVQHERTHNFRFKIGFEFQLGGPTCPEALKHSELQKKPLFEIKKGTGNKKLWHVEIDGKEIEFVTEPFKDTENEDLKNTLDQIKQCVKILHMMSKDKNIRKIKQEENHEYHFSFYDYFNKIEDYIKKQEGFKIELTNDFKQITEKNINITPPLGESTLHLFSENTLPKDIETKHTPAILKLNNGEYKLIITKEDKVDITKLPDDIDHNYLNGIFDKHFDKDKGIGEIFQTWDESIMKSIIIHGHNPSYEDCKLNFQPQVTIQHPLEYTIPLFFSLFGYDDEMNMREFLASIPHYNLIHDTFSYDFEGFKNIQKSNSIIYEIFNKKMEGLSFLHAATLVGMTPDDETEDKKFLEDTWNEFDKYQQIDPKAEILLMSRRPFSSMLNEILQDKKGEDYISYSEFFEKNIRKGNELFERFYKVPKFLFKTNYGEQFFEEHGSPRDLSHFTNFFDEAFLKENQGIIKELLKIGIVSTTMIRNMIDAPKDLTSPEDYYKNIIDTVEYPKGRYRLNFQGPSSLIENVRWKYDMLSPPCFLHEDNSMGRLTNDENIDKEYGEAIVEIRSIRNVGRWALNKMKLNEEKIGFFLDNPSEIDDHGMKLFDFLSEFKQQENFIEDFNLGICYGLITTRL